jgi:hypothetical protein
MNSEQMARYRFPLDVLQIPKGFVVVVRLTNGQTCQLLKPGWEDETHAPYIFQSAEQAWYFLRKLFLFCVKMQHTQYECSDKIINCDQCGRVIRAKFFQTCVECLKESDLKLNQIWQGFYYMTGSAEDAKHKMALLLKIPLEKFESVPEPFRSLFTECINVNNELEEKKKATPLPMLPKVQPSSGMRSSRSHRTQL